MNSLMVLSAIGEDRVGIVQQLTKVALACECTMVDQRVSVLGGQCAVIIMFQGDWNALTKLEYELPTLAQELNLTTVTQKSPIPEEQSQLLPYAVRLTALDVPGVANKLSEFFAKRDINIEEIYAHSYNAPITDSRLVKIKMQISLSPQVQIHALKDDFKKFCLESNLDARLYPIHY